MFTKGRFVCAVVFAAALFSAIPAAAAPVGWSTVDVTVHSEQSGASTLLVAGKLPDSTALPADVELALPAGAQVQWAGEILGGAVDKDPSVTYTKSTRDGRDIYRFRLTKARTGQIEAAVPGLVAFDGGRYTAAVKWKPSQDVPKVNMSVRVPRNAQVQQQVTGASLVTAGQTGYSYYTKSFTDTKAGKELDLTFAYTAAAVAGTVNGTSAGGSNSVAPVIVLLVAAGGFGLLASSVSKKMREKQTAPPAVGGSVKRATASAATSKKTNSAGKESVRPVEVQAAKPSMSGPKKIGILVAGILSLIVAAVFLSNGTASARWVDGKLTKQYASVDACSKADIPVAFVGDVRGDSPKLLDALQRLEGIKTATVYEAGPKIEVEYCTSRTSEEQIRQTLAQTGVVSVTQATRTSTASTTPDAAGKK